MIKILKLGAVMNLTGLSRSSVYLYTSKGEFPTSIKLGPRSVGWVESEIIAWLDGKVAVRNGKPTPAKR